MVWERIHQKINEKDAATKAAEATAQARRLENQHRQKEDEQRAIRERQQRIEKTRAFINETGVLPHLEQIKIGVVGARKDIVIDPVSGTVTLAWGRYHLNPGGTTIEYSTFTRVMDYSFIRVQFNADKRTIGINRKELQEEDWKNRNKLLDVLSDAYLAPERVNESKNSSSGGYTSSNNECCCQ